MLVYQSDILCRFWRGKGSGAVIFIPYDDDFQVIEHDTHLMPAICYAPDCQPGI